MSARFLLLAVAAAPLLATSRPTITVPTGTPGPLSRAEFVDHLDKFFRHMDVKGHGYITPDDLVFPGYHIPDPPVIFYPGAKMPFHCVDANRDGRISEQEYVAYGERAFDAVATDGAVMMPWNASQLRRAISTDARCK